MASRGDLRIVNRTGAVHDTEVEVCIVEHGGGSDAHWQRVRGVVSVELAPITAGDPVLRASILFELLGGVDIAVQAAQLQIPQRET